MRVFTVSILAASSIAFSCIAQSNAPTKPQRQRDEEDRVAQLIETIRKEAGLKPLNRVAPSPYMAELTCTVLVTGKSLDSITHYKTTETDDFQIYSTNDPQSRSSALSFLASDWEPRKYIPQYSVVVFKDVSHPGRSVIGVARGQSKFRKWWGCTSLNINNWFEDGCTPYPIKPSIAAECVEAK